MKIPTPAEVDSEIQRIESLKNNLSAEIAKDTAEARSIRSKPSLSPGTAAENRVRAILGEPQVPDISPDMVRLGELLKHLHDKKIAYDILDRRLQDRKQSASRKVCEIVAPEHSKLAKRFAACIIDLHAAHTDYVRFCDAVTNTGASTTALQPVWPTHFGHPSDSSGAYHYALQDFVDSGHLAKKDVPEVVR